MKPLSNQLYTRRFESEILWFFWLVAVGELELFIAFALKPKPMEGCGDAGYQRHDGLSVPKQCRGL